MKESKIETGESTRTFVVKMKYRHNRTWQGELVREDTNQKEHFRSEFELLNLIQSALEDESELEGNGTEENATEENI